MVKNCPIIFFGFLFAVLMAGSSFAQTPSPKSGSSTVNASVTNPTSTPTPTPTATVTPTPSVSPSPTPTLAPGVSPTKTPTPTPTSVPVTPSKDIYINISGLASPNASILMTTNVFLRSTVANSNGEFSITQVKISEAQKTFCLEAVDFKKVGTSFTCFETPGQAQDFTKDDIFLPPTMGLSARRISTKGSAYFFGYTMPNSTVTSHIAAGNELVSPSDRQGYYRVEVKDLPVGTYHLFATAVYETKSSSKPNKTLELRSVTQGEAVGDEFKSIWNRLFSSLRGFIERFGWIGIPIIILLIILIAKVIRDRMKESAANESVLKFAGGKKPEENKLHHDWFL